MTQVRMRDADWSKLRSMERFNQWIDPMDRRDVRQYERLVARGYAEKRRSSWGTPMYRITDAGRAALAQQAAGPSPAGA